MSKYDNASLVQIPSGYKAGTLYSVLPANGDGDFNFTRASIATRVNAEGLIETVASGVPRLDYPILNGVVQSCPALLLEPARTNLVTYSEDFSNAAWIKTGATTVTSNTVISPDGTQNASTISGLTGSGSNDIYVITGLNPASKTYFASVYLKGNGTLRLQISNNVNQGFVEIITLTSDWKRHTITGTFNSTSGNLSFTIDDSTSTATQFDAWGAQLEEGSYATSYIPTSGSTVARAAEVCNGAGTSAEFNDSEGVLFVETAMLSSNPNNSTFQVDDGTSTNRLRIRFTTTTNQVNALLYDGSAGQPNIDFTSNSVVVFNKVAVVYQVNQIDLYLNGFKVGTSTGNAAPSGFNNLSLGVEGKTKQAIAFDAALTDEQLEDLTSWDSFEELAASQFYTLY